MSSELANTPVCNATRGPGGGDAGISTSAAPLWLSRLFSRTTSHLARPLHSTLTCPRTTDADGSRDATAITPKVLPRLVLAPLSRHHDSASHSPLFCLPLAYARARAVLWLAVQIAHRSYTAWIPRRVWIGQEQGQGQGARPATGRRGGGRQGVGDEVG